MKIATSFSVDLLLVASLVTGMAVWLLRVTIEVNAKKVCEAAKRTLPCFMVVFTGWQPWELPP